jgi:hypothetical protein
MVREQQLAYDRSQTQEERTRDTIMLFNFWRERFCIWERQPTALSPVVGLSTKCDMQHIDPLVPSDSESCSPGDGPARFSMLVRP